MACIIAHGRAFEKFVKDNHLDKGMAVYAILQYQRETGDYSNWPNPDDISRMFGRDATFETEREDLVELWNKRYSNPYRHRRASTDNSWLTSSEVQDAIKIFGRENVFAYIDTTANKRVLLVKKPVFTEGPLASFLSDSNDTEQVIQGKLGVNKQQLIHLLGSTMYQSGRQEVAVKELMQNAFDAVKIAKSQGKIDHGVIDVDLDDSNRTVRVSDNGTGMTPEIVQKAFFTIGGSYKGEGTDNKLKSGGLGLAKMAFLFGSDYVDVTTIKDGVKTHVRATPEEIQNDDFNIVTSKTDEPNGTTVEVKIPETYTNQNGEERPIWFTNAPDFLRFPMIGDVTVNVTTNNWGSKETKSYDKSQIPSGYTYIGNATSAFGDIELYISPNPYASSSITNDVLISGLHQFRRYVYPQDDRARLNIIMNILPSVGVQDPVYPMNNQREGFRETIKPEVEDLDYLIKRMNRTLERKSIREAFGRAITINAAQIADVKREMPQQSPEVELASIKTEVEEVLKEISVPNPKTGENTIDLKAVRTQRVEEKSRRSSLNTSGVKFEDESVASVDTSNLDINKPVFHNNTDMVIEEDGQKVITKIGELMLKLKSLYMQTYADISIKTRYGVNIIQHLQSQFWGISFDKGYGGVNVNPSVMSLLAINPFYNVATYSGVDSVLGLTEYITHLIIHEFNHNYVGGEDSSFTGRFPSTYAEFAGIGNQFNEWKAELADFIKDNFSTFKKYEQKYNDSKNLGESLPSGERISRDAQGTESSTSGNGKDLQGDRSGGNVQGHGGEFDSLVSPGAPQGAVNRKITVLDGVDTTGVYVVPGRKGLAGFNPKTGQITLQKPRFVPIEVINHLYGRNGQPYSDQKAEVMNRLAAEGWTEDVIKDLISNSEAATSFIVLHEQSHRDNTDSYDVKTYMSEEALAIETRATRDALTKLRGFKESTEEILEDRKNVITWSGEDVHISDYTADDGVSEVLVHPRKDSEQGVIIRRNTDGPWVVIQNTGDMGSRHVRKTVHRVADIIPIGQEISVMALGDNTQLIELLKNDGFEDNGNGTLVKKKITTADLHITPVAEGGYRTRTVHNARTTDFTIALAENFNTAGERLTARSAGPKKYVNAQLNGTSKDNIKDIVKQVIAGLVRNNNGKKPQNIVLNIAGNSAVTLSQDQGYYNSLVTGVVKGLLENGITIREIRSGGQTGIDEAGIKAAQRLGLQWSVVGTSSWTYRVKADNKKGYNDINDRGAFIDRFNGEVNTVQYKPFIAPSLSGGNTKYIKVSTRSIKDSDFTAEHTVKVTNNKVVATDIKNEFLYRIQTEELGIGSKIVPDISDIRNLGTMLKALSDISRMYLKNGEPIRIPRNKLSTVELAAYHDIAKDVEGVTVTDKAVYVPTYTVGYTEDRLKVMRFEKQLTESGVFKNTELRAWAKSAVFRLSDIITNLQENPEYAKKLFSSPEYQQYADVDYSNMSRIEILDPETGPGLKVLLSLVKELIFNPANRPDVSGFTRTRMQYVYNNFSAFIKYGYDSLTSLEGVSLNNDFVEEEQSGILSSDENIMTMDAETEEELIEIHGSTIKAWQTGFRQISAVLSLARAIKLEIGKFSELDDEGMPILDEELGTRKTISASDAATKILAWVQGADTLEEMITKLQAHMKAEPWLRQLVGEYHSGEEGEGPVKQGLLLDPKKNGFASEFFVNFRKYFQNYCITFEDKDKEGNKITKIKMINNSSFADSTLKALKNLAANKQNGGFLIWDEQTRELSKDFFRLKNDIIGVEDPAFGVSARKGSMYDILKGYDTEDATPDSLLQKISEAYSILQIPVPAISELRVVFPTVGHIVGDGGFWSAMQYLLRGLEQSYNPKEGLFDPFYEDSVARNYKNLINLIAPVMQTGLEAVTYQGGKLHYSYVTPSYLNLLVDKLKGHVEDYEKFMQEEYLKHVGWFSISEKAPKGLVTGIEFRDDNETFTGILNYWAEQLLTASDKDALRANLQHIVSLSSHKVKYEDMSDAQFTASVIEKYFSLGDTYALFNVPTMSNKKSEEYIKFKKIVEDYDNRITYLLTTRVFVQEVNRIRTVKDRLKNAPENHRIESFDDERQNGTKFMFLDFLNKYMDSKNKSPFAVALRKYVNGGSWKSGAVSVDDVTYQNENDMFIKLLPQVIRSEVDSRFEKYVQSLADSAFLKYDKENKSISDVFQVGDKIGEGQTGYNNLREFFWNDMFASINILQLTITDLALYPDAGQVQKRLAELHSPGMRGNVNALDIKTGKPVSDGIYRTAYIADEIKVGDIIDNLLALHTKILSDSKYRDDKGNLTEDGKTLARRFDSLRDIIANVNTADGQAFTSPSAYRKKMHIFGKWNQRWEDAYRKVLAGDYSDDNLDVLWQPLKPFIYGQTFKRNTSKNAKDYMPFIKVGIQNKNSEYVIILADVLMRSAGMNNKLTAIVDVMEESYGLKKKGNAWVGDPNNRGLDSIQFESAVKTGKTGVIDVNNTNDYNEIVKRLKGGIYTKKNGTVVYDDITVDSLPYSNYAIQQNNPASLTKGHKMGSQDRIMAVSDLAEKDSDGNDILIDVPSGDNKTVKMSVREAKKKYLSLLAENINESADLLVKELGLIPPDSSDGIVNAKFRNIALSDLLQKEILRDGRYGRDLLWACSTDINGEFNLPLSDPIHAGRIQMLLNSIIKRRIWDQDIAGGSAIMVSSYGFDDNNQLNVVYKDKEGNILETKFQYDPAKHGGQSFQNYLLDNQASLAYLECYVSVYDERLIEDFGVRDANGKLTGEIDIKKIERVNPRLLELVSYRIPTEAKYSIVPMKIKGFMPRRGGEVLVLPKEITGIAGLDFDVDKNTIMRYEYSRREVKSVNKFVDSYVNANLNSGEKIDSDEIKRIKRSGKAIRAYLYGNEDAISGELKDFVDNAWKEYGETEVRYTTKVRGHDAKRRNNNNQILALQWAFLTSIPAFREISSPGNFDEIKRVGYKLSSLTGKTADEIKNEETKASLHKKGEIDYYKNSFEKPDNIIYADTKMVFHRRNMVAGKLIGVFAQGNVSHSIIGLHRDSEGKQDVYLNVPKNKSFRIRVGNHVAVFDGNIPIDREYDITDAIKASETIASFVGASADAVKDPVLNLLNINMTTVNSLLALMRCGIDLETIGWFLTSPVMMRVVLEQQQNEAIGKKSLRGTISRMKERCRRVNDKVQFNPNFAFSQDYFKDIYSVKQNDIFSDANVQDTYNILTLFERTLDLADAFQYITHMTRFNSVNSAPGPYAINTMMSINKAEKFYTHPYIANAPLMPGKNVSAIKDAVDNPLLLAFRRRSVGIGPLGTPENGLHQMLIQPNFLQAGNFMQQVMERAIERFGYMSKEELMGLSDFVLSYYVNINTPIFDLSFENRYRMIKEYAASIYPKRAEAYKLGNGSNALLDHIRQNFNQSTGEYALNLETRGMLPESLEDIKTGWNDIFNDEEDRIAALLDEDGEITDQNILRNFGVELMEYNFFRHGLGFSPKTWIQEVPAEMRASIKGYLESLNPDKMFDYSLHVDRCIDQYILNTGTVDKGTVSNEDFDAIVPDTRYPVTDRRRNYVANYTRRTGKDFGGLSGYTYLFIPTEDGKSQTVELTYIRINPDKTVFITVVDKLGGGRNDFFEIDPQEDANQIRSVLNYDIVSIEDAMVNPDYTDDEEYGQTAGLEPIAGDDVSGDTSHEDGEFENAVLSMVLDELGVEKQITATATVRAVVSEADSFAEANSSSYSDTYSPEIANVLSQFKEWLTMIDNKTMTEDELVKKLQELNVCGI